MKHRALAPLVLAAALAGCATLPARQDAPTAWVAALSACDAILATDDHGPIDARLRASGFADGTESFTWVWREGRDDSVTWVWREGRDDSVRMKVEPAWGGLGEACRIQVNQSAYSRDEITDQTSAWLARAGFRNDPTASGVRPELTVLAARRGRDTFVLIQNTPNGISAPLWRVALARD